MNYIIVYLVLLCCFGFTSACSQNIVTGTLIGLINQQIKLVGFKIYRAFTDIFSALIMKLVFGNTAKINI
jgi:hypothetical protein